VERGATLHLIQSTNWDHVFGGYLSVNIEHEYGHSSDPYAFLFVLRTSFKNRAMPKVATLINKKNDHVFHNYGTDAHGPAWGEEHSLIADAHWCGKSNTYMNGAGKTFDFVGNEMCGGEQFDDSTDTCHNYEIRNWEIFNVCF
jgi:hypothetical protein